MTLPDYLGGTALLVGTVGACLVAAGILLARCLPSLSGAPRALAFASLGTASVIAAHLIPALFGVLARGTAMSVALLLLAAALTMKRSEPGYREPPAASASAAPWSRRLAMAAALATGVCILAAAWAQTAAPSTTSTDTLTFHLPNVARWIQTGSVWQVDQFIPLQAQGNYPQNGDMVFLSLVLPWHNDAFTRPLNWIYVVVAALSVYAIARELRAPTSTSVLFAACFAALPSMARTASAGAMTDPILLAMLGCGVLFLLRHQRTSRRADLVLGGLSLGLAFGTKWDGVSAVIVLVAVWVLARLVARVQPRRVLGEAARVASLVLAAGGFWMLRNLVESGDPVFPVRLRFLGMTLLSAPRDVFSQRYNFTVADYLSNLSVWRHDLLPAYRVVFGAAGAAIALTAVLALPLASRRRPPGWGLALVVGLATALLVGEYVLTPYSALGTRGHPFLVANNARYALPALLLGAAAGAWAVGRLGRSRAVVELLVAVAVAEGLAVGFHLPGSAVVVGMLSVSAMVAIALLRERLRALVHRGTRPTVLLVALLAAASTVIVGYVRQRQLNSARAHIGDVALDWITTHAPSGHRVGLAGTWTNDGTAPVLPAFGPRLGNRVAYVGSFHDGLLNAYSDQASFTRGLQLGNFDVLVIGRGIPPRAFVPVQAWAIAAGYHQVVTSRRLAVYEIARASKNNATRTQAGAHQ